MIINDRKAARFNPRSYRKHIVTPELYKAWKAKTGYKIPYKQFKAYWVMIADEMISSIIEERDGIRLGSGIGDLYIAYVYSKKTAIDRPTSEQLQKIIKYQNWNSSGKLGKIIYGTNHRRYTYKRSGWYAFIAHRDFKKKVSQALLSHPARYKHSMEKNIK